MTISQVFLNLVNISITASWLVLAIVLFRLVFKKAPKYIVCALWALVAIRLIIPISIESPVSLIPSKETIPLTIEYSKAPALDTGFSSLDTTLNPIITESFAPKDDLTSMNPIQLPIYLGAYIWQTGIVIMLCYALVSYIIIRLKVREKIKTDTNIYICDRIPSPFILGLICPKIYLPSQLNEAELSFVIAHEKAHIKRLDFIWKPLGFVLLSVYWFNPVMWLGYILLCRDIEYACDEKVVKGMSITEKKEYSETLLNLSIHRPYVTACPLAFGESGVKGRIKSVLNYKKPAFWVIVVAIILSIAVAVCFLTNPPAKKFDVMTGTYYSSASLPFINFTDDSSCYLAFSPLASLVVDGNYRITETELIIEVDEGTYTFDLVENGFVFSMEKSTLNTVEFFPDGTIFSKGIDSSFYSDHLTSDQITPFDWNDGMNDNALKNYYQDDISDVMNLTEAKHIDIRYFDYDFNGDDLTDKFVIVASPLHSGTAGDSINILINNGDGTYKNICGTHLRLPENPTIFISPQTENYPTISIITDKVYTMTYNGKAYTIPNKFLEDELFNLAVSAEEKIEQIINSEVSLLPENLTYSSLCERMEDFCHGNAVSIFLEKNACMVNPRGEVTCILLNYMYKYSEYDRNDFTLLTEGELSTAIFKRYHDKTKPETCREYLYVFTPNASGKHVINDILVEENGEWVRVNGVW